MKENQQVEWKTAWRDDYLRWICGFANAEGGRLVIGRDDRGVAVGVDDARRLMEEIPNKVRDLLGILVAIHLRREKGKELIEIRVEPHPNPISYRGEYYLRSGSTNQMLKGAALDRFLLRKHGRTWDGVPLPGVKQTDLEPAALKTFRQLAQKSQRLPDSILDEPDRALLEKLHLVEGTYLTRAAILLFHPDPQRFFPNATIKIGYFEAGAGLRYQDEIEGNLIAQINQTLEVLKSKYLRAWISYAGLQRLETWPVPLAALREALLNAVVHRDYAMSGPIQISVYPDKLLIWNPGELPPSWTVRNLLRKHASVPFNPAVARTFFRTGMIEAWGQGIERIRDATREAGTPEPELNAEPTGLWVEFRYLPEHVAATGEAPEMTPVEAQTPVETPVEISGEGWTPVETPVETPVKTPAAIMALLQENPRLTLAEVAEKLGRSRRAVERETARLVSGGHLRFIGARKSGHWEVAPKRTPITGEMTSEIAGMTPESRTTTLEMTPERDETTLENRGTTLEDGSGAGSSTGEVTGEERGIASETAAATPETGETTQEMTPITPATTLETQETTQETTSLPVQRRLIHLIAANPRITQLEMAAAIGLTQDGIRYHLNKMRQDGRVRHAGPRKGGHWEILE